MGTESTTSLTSLSFIDVDVSLRDIDSIGGFLVHQQCVLKSLIFIRNNFDPQTFEALCSGFAKNKSVLALVLDDNGLRNKDIYKLKDALVKRGSEAPLLGLLSLSKNLIDDAGIEALSRALKTFRIHRLDLSHNNLSHYSVLYLKDAVRELFHIDLSFNTRLGLRGFVEIVTLYHTSTCLSWVNLSGLNLGEDATEELIGLLKSHVCRIKRLGLSDNRLGDEFGAELAVALAINTSLVELDLSRNLFTNQCIRHLAVCLQFNRHLASLHLRQLPETVASSTALVLIRAVRTSARITTLSIDLTQDELAQKLRGCLAENRALYEKVANDACHFLNIARLLLHSRPPETPQRRNIGDLPFELMLKILQDIAFLQPPSSLSYQQFRSIVEYSAQSPSLARPSKRDVVSTCRGPREAFLNQVGCLRPNLRPTLPSDELLQPRDENALYYF